MIGRGKLLRSYGQDEIEQRKPSFKKKLTTFQINCVL